MTTDSIRASTLLSLFRRFWPACWRHTVEFTILAIVLTLTVTLTPPQPPLWATITMMPDKPDPSNFSNLLLSNFAAIMLGLLILLSIRIRVRAIALPIFLLPLGALAFHTWNILKPIYEELGMQATNLTTLQPGFPVPSSTVSAKPLLPIISALATAAWLSHAARPTCWRWLLGWVLGWCGAVALLYRNFYDLRSLTTLTAFIMAVLLGTLLWILPLQRRALNVLILENPSTAPQPATAPPSWKATCAAAWNRLTLTIAVIGYTALTGILAISSPFERGLMKLPFGQDAIARRDPSLIDAGPAMRAYYMPSNGAQRTTTTVTYHGASFITDNPFDTAWTETGTTEVFQRPSAFGPTELSKLFPDSATTPILTALRALAPMLRPFETAPQADIMLPPNPDEQRPNYYFLRQASRALLVRSALAVRDHRSTDSLRDIESVLCVGTLLMTDPNAPLVQIMVGSATANVALQMAQTYVINLQDDEPALAQFATSIQSWRSRIYLPFPENTLRQTEPGFWPVVPLADAMIPAMMRATHIFYMRRCAWEQLAILTAVRRYELHHGTLPPSLNALVPQYLPRLPLDPFDGKPYEANLSDPQSLYVTISIVSRKAYPLPSAELLGPRSTWDRPAFEKQVTLPKARPTTSAKK